MRHLDTSLLVSALTGPQPSALALHAWLTGGNRVGCSTLVVYEYLRGPRRPVEVERLYRLLRDSWIVDFGVEEARTAASLYRALGRVRGREIDLAIAACALVHDAAVWTLNPRDFRDIPDLDVV
jgi:predicted nucleic acid-binding protein